MIMSLPSRWRDHVEIMLAGDPTSVGSFYSIKRMLSVCDKNTFAFMGIRCYTWFATDTTNNQ